MPAGNLFNNSAVPFVLSLKHKSRAALLLFISVYLVTPSANGIDDKAQLKSLQRNITEKSKSVDIQIKQRSKLLTQLEREEKNIATAGRKLRGITNELTRVEREIHHLSDSITRLQQQRSQQTALLSQQLDAAFRLGKHNLLQLLLNNEQTTRSERLLAQYGYLNAARQQTLTDLRQTQRQLTQQKNTLLEKQRQKKQTLSEQLRQQAQLAHARTARKQTLVTLESTLKKNQTDLAELQRNQRHLQNKIALAERRAREQALRDAREAEKVRQRQAQAQTKGSVYQPSSEERALVARARGLGQPVGRARWPVRGRVVHQFGEPIQGELRWKGLVINAPEGSEVYAVADGKVIMADWLQGYGLVVVIAHGQGDMSLYGYNQTALVDVGSNVRAGQAVALVGNSGGRETPALYFEIRRQGKAVDPRSWLGA